METNIVSIIALVLFGDLIFVAAVILFFRASALYVRFARSYKRH
jgi:hypothetical protein